MPGVATRDRPRPSTADGPNNVFTDRDGNVYFRDMATLTESVESVRAVRRNGGLAMAVVQRVDEPGGEAIGVAAADLDAVIGDELLSLNELVVIGG